jgi:oligoribonuclease NrnB/cAMP/cGMP phosphodiesterase (DHH superfamily)
VRKALGNDVEFHAGVYGDPPPDVANRDVIMVDFSYKRPVLEGLLRSGDLNQANTILILDHHKTAAAELVGVREPEGLGGRGAFDPAYWRGKWERDVDWPVRAVFDQERSGAQIAWDFFYPGSPRRRLVDYVGDRDLWRFEAWMSREVNALISANDYTFENWYFLERQLESATEIVQVAAMGSAIEKKHNRDVKLLVDLLKRRITIGGICVPVANIPYTHTSEAGHLMAQNEPFAACYWDTADGRTFSLRSTDTGLDVSEIAKRYGGGGHRNASGFRVPLGWEGDGAAVA